MYASLFRILTDPKEIKNHLHDKTKWITEHRDEYKQLVTFDLGQITTVDFFFSKHFFSNNRNQVYGIRLFYLFIVSLSLIDLPL